MLIPRHQGQFEFGPVAFTYFDLEKKSYVTLKTPVYNLNVERGADGGSATTMGKSDFQILGRDIRFIKTQVPEFVTSADNFYGSVWFWILSLVPFAGLVFLINYRKKHLALNSDLALVKSRKATKMARKRLDTANNLLKSGNQIGFYDEAGKAIWLYMSDKLKLPISMLTKESAVEALKNASVSSGTIDSFVSTLDQCEYARFARMDSGRSAEQVYQETVNLITKIEDEIKA
ncbi:MAG: BatD family protein [Bacteroidetes bacterium]|nr:BatD family protein [Bacteroidota bacterium]